MHDKSDPAGIQTILMPFTPANMDLFALSVNIADLHASVSLKRSPIE